MAVAIKTLEDLRRVEANLKVICLDCGGVAMIDREELIVMRRGHRCSLEWEAVKADMVCQAGSSGCLSHNVRIETPAFSDDVRELLVRRYYTRLLNGALEVLRESNRRSTKERTATRSVALALRVLHPFVRDRALLEGYWEAASAEPTPWSGCNQHLRWIVRRLLDRGHPVYAEYR